MDFYDKVYTGRLSYGTDFKFDKNIAYYVRQVDIENGRNRSKDIFAEQTIYRWNDY